MVNRIAHQDHFPRETGSAYHITFCKCQVSIHQKSKEYLRQRKWINIIITNWSGFPFRHLRHFFALTPNLHHLITAHNESYFMHVLYQDVPKDKTKKRKDSTYRDNLYNLIICKILHKFYVIYPTIPHVLVWFSADIIVLSLI